MRSVATLEVGPVSRLFRALGDPIRVRIVALLSHGELCVCHVEAALALSQPNASRHLGVLKNAGVVESRKDGSWVYHRLAKQADEACARQLKALVAEFSKASELRRDLERLMKSKGPGVCR
jgi:ArsR family transcriptional regulator